MKPLIRKGQQALHLARNHDWSELRLRVKTNLFPGSSPGSAADYWDDAQSGKGTQWYEAPGMHSRWNKLISDDPDVDSVHWVAQKYFARHQPRSILSLACGDGDWELVWAEVLKPAYITGYDLSPERIKRAQESVSGDQYGEVTRFSFEVADLNHFEPGEERFDIIMAKAGLHHLENLEYVFGQVSKHLSDQGLFIVDEFVGPSRFQWPDRQLEVINSLLRILPRHLRRSLLNPGRDKAPVSRLSIDQMLATDPSESARSAEIPELLCRHFDILEWKPYGGGILHLLLAEIAGNFDDSREEDRELLEWLFAAEDYFMLTGEIPSDYLFAVCRSRK